MQLLHSWISKFLKQVTYHLVNLGDLGLEDGDGISNGWLFGGTNNGGGSEVLGSHLGHLDLAGAKGKLRKHPYYNYY